MGISITHKNAAIALACSLSCGDCERGPMLCSMTEIAASLQRCNPAMPHETPSIGNKGRMLPHDPCEALLLHVQDAQLLASFLPATQGLACSRDESAPGP
jgi:hypothetical protein